jgi:hypothetical protein
LDEAQHVLSSAKGEKTVALDNLRAITMHPRGVYARARMLHPAEAAEMDALNDQMDDLKVKIRDRKSTQDERDRAIDAFANRVGYGTLIVLLLVFLFALGFAPKPAMARFTHWLIANTLLNLIMFSCLAQYVAQLAAYWRDARDLGRHAEQGVRA